MPLRDQLYQEWYAELHAPEAVEGSAPLAVAYRRLRFAASLVCRAGVNEDLEPRDWHNRLAAFQPSLRPIIGLLAVPLLGGIAFSGLASAAGILLPASEDGEVTFASQPSALTLFHVGLSLLCLVVAVVATGMVGAWLGRTYSIGAPSVVGPVILGVGIVTATLLPAHSQISVVHLTVGILVWVLLTTALIGRLRRYPYPAWRRAIAATVGGAGIAYAAVTAVVLSTMIGMHVGLGHLELGYLAGSFPASLLHMMNIDMGPALGDLPAAVAVENAGLALSLPILMSTAFGLAYARRSTKSAPQTQNTPQEIA